MTTKILRLDQIRLDGDTQPRETLDTDVVSDYADAYRSEAVLPAVEVCFDGEHYWLWDGFHRHAGMMEASFDSIKANVRKGTLEDARWLALSANKTHGQRRTNEDKRRAVGIALRIRPDWSDRSIAEHVGVHHDTVSEYRKRLSESDSGESETTLRPRIDRNGRTIETRDIGSREPESRGESSADLWSADVQRKESLPPRYPHSDMMRRWLERCTGQSCYIDAEPPSGLGGITALLAEPDKWDWDDVQSFIIPMLEAHQATIARYLKEIRTHEAHEDTPGTRPRGH